MARRGPPADPDRLDDRAMNWRAAAATIVALALAVVAVLYGGVLQREPSRSHHQVTVVARIGPNVLIGPDALAAAFRAGLRCQTLTFARGDPRYFRAQPDHTGACRWSSPGQPIVYREVGREFRPVLDAADYACPVRDLPVIVQRELSLCPRDR
jgi:hypothetical protein